VAEAETLAAGRHLLDFYRCPNTFVNVIQGGSFSAAPAYFKFGEDVVCFGHSTVDGASRTDLMDLLPLVSFHGSAVRLPFDLSAVVKNLRFERYGADGRNGRSTVSKRAVQAVYYYLRPFLPVAVRKHLQKLWHAGWETQKFPQWPVDTTVECLAEKVLVLSMKAQGIDRVPFVWFWPEGATGAAIVTHDVETKAGLSFLPRLMDVDEEFGVKASIQLIPQNQYQTSQQILDTIRNRGFEVNIQDLNHDGDLFSSRQEFLSHAREINRYLGAYGARGFRSGRLYRNVDWYDALDISYDMSVPNVGHLEAQPGGCCTVFPYFIGNILEIPLTTIQDYCLLNILGKYSTELWRRQVAIILEKHGLASFIIHPDYIRKPRALQVYRDLLAYLSDLRESRAWVTLPGELDRWWRQRSQMELVKRGDTWQVAGPGKESARLAWANLRGDRLTYDVEA
jgi:hypothetical protein